MDTLCPFVGLLMPTTASDCSLDEAVPDDNEPSESAEQEVKSKIAAITGMDVHLFISRSPCETWVKM